MRNVFRALRTRAVAYRLQILIGGGALLLLVLIGVVYALMHPQPEPSAEAIDGSLPKITLDSTYVDGTHTIEGTVELKNRCQRLDTSAILDDSVTPPIIRVDITSDDDQGICLEIPDTREFSIEVDGPEDAATQVFINGLPLNGEAL